MSLASMTSDVHPARVLRCARSVYSGAIRTQVLRHFRASFDPGAVFGRDSDTGTILGRHIAMFAPPSGELSPDNEIRVLMSPESGMPACSPSMNEACTRVQLENPKAGETR